MRTEIINAEKLEMVKKLTEGKWHKMENNTNSIVILQADSVSNAEYSEIADIDCNTLEKLGGFYGILEYFENGGQFMLKCETYMNTEEEDSFEERLSVVYADSCDFLDLFKKEERVDNVQKNYINNYFNDNMENIADKLEEDFPEVYEKLKEQIIENLGCDDVGGCLAEEVALNWISYNQEDAFDKAIDEMGDYTLKDKIKEAIDSL